MIFIAYIYKYNSPYRVTLTANPTPNPTPNPTRETKHQIGIVYVRWCSGQSITLRVSQSGTWVGGGLMGGNLVPSTLKCQISIRQLLFNIDNLFGSSSFHVFILYLIILTIVYIHSICDHSNLLSCCHSQTLK